MAVLIATKRDQTQFNRQFKMESFLKLKQKQKNLIVISTVRPNDLVYFEIMFQHILIALLNVSFIIIYISYLPINRKFIVV